jgi:hypothetical protein
MENDIKKKGRRPQIKIENELRKRKKMGDNQST